MQARWKATGEIAGVKIINIEPGNNYSNFSVFVILISY